MWESKHKNIPENCSAHEFVRLGTTSQILEYLESVCMPLASYELRTQKEHVVQYKIKTNLDLKFQKFGCHEWTLLNR